VDSGHPIFLPSSFNRFPGPINLVHFATQGEKPLPLQWGGDRANEELTVFITEHPHDRAILHRITPVEPPESRHECGRGSITTVKAFPQNRLDDIAMGKDGDEFLRGISQPLKTVPNASHEFVERLRVFAIAELRIASVPISERRRATGILRCAAIVRRGEKGKFVNRPLDNRRAGKSPHRGARRFHRPQVTRDDDEIRSARKLFRQFDGLPMAQFRERYRMRQVRHFASIASTFRMTNQPDRSHAP